MQIYTTVFCTSSSLSLDLFLFFSYDLLHVNRSKKKNPLKLSLCKITFWLLGSLKWARGTRWGLFCLVSGNLLKYRSNFYRKQLAQWSAWWLFTILGFYSALLCWSKVRDHWFRLILFAILPLFQIFKCNQNILTSLIRSYAVPLFQTETLLFWFLSYAIKVFS